eukprot:CAMPEP_0184658908 /NCGR_PEP_ID=MMETSP0308-20130426/27297_1 /TAXON_ID=38269 /ORGANISM="Gloeochaete witrockiana, Strain SAG 46.84" /LENGTH=297 /DNA_ID=CAMNT_0027098263 /DNA_START=52 /DNA_END=942 /DNA_ORIENTATION=+
MDVLKKEIEKKRKLISESSGKKWAKRSELDKIALEKEKEKFQKSPPPKPFAAGTETPNSRASPSPPLIDKKSDVERGTSSPGVGDGPIPEVKTVTPLRKKTEVIRRLRLRGEPATFFGETDEQRDERLRQLEAAQEDSGNGEKNVFQELLNQQDEGGDSKSTQGDNDNDSDRGSRDSKRSKDGENVTASGELPKLDKSKMFPQDYARAYFQRLLTDWENELNDRPDTVKKTAQGKVQTAIQKQCRRFIKPLFKLLKSRQCPKEILETLLMIIDNCEKREYVAANDNYLKLAIGNAPW